MRRREAVLFAVTVLTLVLCSVLGAQVGPDTMTTPSLAGRVADATPTSANLATVYEIETCFANAGNHMQFAMNLAWTARADKIIEARNQMHAAVVLLGGSFDIRFEKRLKAMEASGAVRLSGPLREDRAALLALAEELKLIVYEGSEEKGTLLRLSLREFAERGPEE